jgi:hypothetical protein
MLEKLQKTDPACNNIYLIDERLCLQDSFNIINTNFSSLSSTINSLTETANQFNALYTEFIANSATWSVGANNTNGRTEVYNQIYNLTNNLSSTWSKEFSVYYPSLISLSAYYQNTNEYKTRIKNWLNFQFSPFNFSDNQKINVYLNLKQTDLFTFKFSGSYEERCTPLAPPKQVCCTGASCGELHRGCNLDDGDRHYCINAYSVCGKSLTNACATGACSSTGAKNLKLLSITNSYNDTYTSKSIVLKFKKIGSVQEWINYS